MNNRSSTLWNTFITLAALVLATHTALAGSATWLSAPATSDWNTGGNWTAGGPPNSSGDTATFDLTNTTGVSLSLSTTVNSVVFNAGASAYTITAPTTFTLTISGTGVVNNSSTTQNFVTGTVASGTAGVISFTNGATAGSNVVYTNSGGANNGQFGGGVQFSGSSTAGSGTFNSLGGTVPNSVGGYVEFLNNSTAGNAVFNIYSGAVANASEANVSFDNNASAGNGTFTNYGGSVSSSVGAFTAFGGNSDAGSSTLIATSGTGLGPGGQIDFRNDSTGGTARVEVFGTGFLYIAGHNAGTVTIGSLEGDGSVFLGNNGLAVGTNNLDTVFSGSISDSGTGIGGSFTKTGTGTLILSGSSNYLGGTTLTSGALILNNENAISTGALTIASGTIGSDVDTLVFANKINVSGDFSVRGPGGGTSVAPTYLTFSGNVDLQGGTRVITSQVSYSNTILNGVISNGGVTLSAGAGVQGAFFGFFGATSNTYTGLTTVNNNVFLQLTTVGVAIPGNLLINSGGTVYQDAGEQIANTSTVTVNSTGNGAGTSGWSIDNTNTETIAALLGNGKVAVDGTLIVGAGNFSGAIGDGDFGGTGQLVKNGAGTLILGGNNTYTGDTTINGGLLQVDGSTVSANTTVNAGGALGGKGTVGGNVTNSGIVAPGDSPGTLTIAGNYTQTAIGALVIQIAGTGAGLHDLLAVGGLATLDGTVQFVNLGNVVIHAGDKIVFLTAGTGVQGQFSKVDTGTLLGAQVIYEPKDVLVLFTQGSFVDFAAASALTSNQTATARNLDVAVNDARAQALIAFLNGEPLANLPHDFDLIAPEELTSLFEITRSFADVQGNNVENHLATVRAEGAPSVNVGLLMRSGDNSVGLRKDSEDKKTVSAPALGEPHWALFMEGSGDFVRVNGDLNASGYNFTTGGVTVGADYRASEHFTIGIMGGYANTGATLTQGGSVDVDSGRLGIYSTIYGGGFYLNTLATGGYNSYDTHRAGLGGIARGNTNGEEFDGLLSGGYDIHAGNFTVGPIASVQYTYLGIDNYTEAGSLAPLNIPSQSQDSLRSKAGFRVSSLWHIGGIAVTPVVSAAWQHEYLDSTYALSSRFASGAGNTFTVRGPSLGRDSVVVNAGVNVQWTERLGTYLSYDGELGRKNYQLNSVSGGVRLGF